MLRRRSSAAASPSPRQLADELPVPFGCAFPRTPARDFPHVDTVPEGDEHRHIEALPVGPVKERGESIAAGVRGRKSPDRSARGGDSLENRLDREVAADPERAWRKLDEERRPRMEILIVAPKETDTRHRLVESRRRRRRLKDEIEILGRVFSRCVNRGTRASRQHRVNSSFL